jgi:hypothetical protein
MSFDRRAYILKRVAFAWLETEKIANERNGLITRGIMLPEKIVKFIELLALCIKPADLR